MRKVMRFMLGAALPLSLATAVQAAPAHAAFDCTTTSQDYEVVDLFDLSRGYAINEQGHVAGERQKNNDPASPAQAAVWRDGKTIDLGYLFGGWLRGQPNSVATDIDDQDRVVGYSNNLDGNNHAFLWQNGFMRDLESWGNESWALAIGGGVVGGWWRDPKDTGDLFQKQRSNVWEDGTSAVTPGGRGSEIVDMNANGDATGNMGLSNASGPYASARDRAHRVFARINYDFRDIGTLGGKWSLAGGINDNGQVVGSSATDDLGLAHQGFIWDRQNGMRKLAGHDVEESAEESAEPKAINNAGTVVGQYGCYAVSSPAVWQTPATPPVRLPRPANATQAWAEDLNERGDIVGWAQTSDGKIHAVVWRKKS
jgi:probable HAF family extracellular repeat protein